jgi:hypothetical protein
LTDHELNLDQTGGKMIQAITSLIGKTIDVYLKINSSESRRRKFAKDFFGIYKGLNEVIDSLDQIKELINRITKTDKEASLWKVSSGVFPEYITVKSWSSDGTIEIQTLQIAKDGTEKLSSPRKMRHDEILRILLSTNIRELVHAFNNIARIMQTESWDLWRIRDRPELLTALEIYDEKIVDTFINAWFEDGGFVEVLKRLGLRQEIDGHLKVQDADFEPERSVASRYRVKPTLVIYDLSDPKHVKAFMSKINSCRKTVTAARKSVKDFISEKCLIEDIL